MLNKKFGPIFKELKNWVWDPGSGKNLFLILDPGVKRHRIPDPDPQHLLMWEVFT
jgi:hypothetical protein